MLVPFSVQVGRIIRSFRLTFRPYGEDWRRFNVPVAISLFYIAFGASASSASEPSRILALGDSLTAGYGLSQSESFPSQLIEKLRAADISADIVNAGVSGDTTSGALQRLDWLMDGPYDLAIVELGANDALRAVDPSLTKQNLGLIVAKLKAQRIPVLLAGMKAPRNLGKEYGLRFDRLFPELAKKHDLHFYPFFLEGVAAVPELNQQDGLHPNAKGVAMIAERMLPFVIKALGKDPQ